MANKMLIFIISWENANESKISFHYFISSNCQKKIKSKMFRSAKNLRK